MLPLSVCGTIEEIVSHILFVIFSSGICSVIQSVDIFTFWSKYCDIYYYLYDNSLENANRSMEKLFCIV